MQKPRAREPAGPAQPVRARILGAAFAAFTEQGYAGTTTLDIATRAKVSKRDLYANFGSKEAMLLACIKSRTERMRLPADRPAPRNRASLAASLTQFGATLLREGSHPLVVAMLRLAVAEATRAPEVAQALEASGRGATRRALAELLAGAQAERLIGAGEPSNMAAQFLALLWGDLMLNLLLGLAAAPGPADIAERAENAAAAFLRLHPAPPRRR